MSSNLDKARSSRKRGTCARCGYRQNLCKDGNVAFHRLYIGSEGRVCDGSGQPEKFAAENAAWAHIQKQATAFRKRPKLPNDGGHEDEALFS